MVGRRMHLSANGVRLIPFRIIRIPALKHGVTPDPADVSQKGSKTMNAKHLFLPMLALALAAGTAVQAQDTNSTEGRAIITVLSKHDKSPAPAVSPSDIKVSVDGKPAQVASLVASQSPDARIEFVILIDNTARASLAIQFGDIRHFVRNLPPNARVALGYMNYGSVQMATPLTHNRDAVMKSLRITSGPAYSNGSPYFCLSELAKHWPSSDMKAQREVLMITDGIDNYERRFDPEDPYVQTAIQDATRARLVVYTLYWHGRGNPGSSSYVGNGGQNLLMEVSSATGGYSYWQGFGNPVSFEPFLNDLNQRLRNQYEMTIKAPYSGKDSMLSMHFHLDAKDAKATAPEQVYVYHPNGSPMD